ncbi:MAG: sporulation transcriptional regulator SpoIIID [Clostridia bacterium]|nr:sporulation transcriptional regulator SpoIIID [Clostridium sp. CAG:389]
MQTVKERIEQRTLDEANYIIANKTTVRATAQAYDKVSKSTVHKDLTERLEDISKSLYDEVQMILNKNKEERAMRGGMSTRQKYLDMKK